MSDTVKPPAIRRTRTRVKAASTMIALALVNAVVWIIALITFHHFPLLLGTCLLAYGFGLRHAMDADHISAIDNVTRKLMNDGQRPALVGFFFSLGHSTIVVILSVLIALSGTHIHHYFPALERVGGLVGTLISALFLLAVAGINLLVLREVFRAFRRVPRGEPYNERDLNNTLTGRGIMGRVFRPIFRIVDTSWKMYFVGFLFGLGFDTATEVGLLGIAAATATQGLPIWSILLFPALFTAGMCLVDTADGIFMLGACGWAYLHPIRKLYYNMTITSVSVLVALVVGGIEVFGIIGQEWRLHGGLWNGIGLLSGNFGAVGAVIVGLFAVSWIVSTLVYRHMRFNQLETSAVTEPPQTP